MSLLYSRFNHFIVNVFFLFFISTPLAIAAESATGSIAGVVTDVETGEPLIQTEVVVYDLDQYSVGWGVTDSNGEYQVDGLSTGRYYVKSQPGGAYVAEMYGGVSCVNWCDFSVGSPIAVTAGQTTAGVDFALQQGGAIAGVVTTADSGGPLSAVSVEVFTAGGDWVGSDWSDAEGRYRVAGLLGGDYLVRVRSAGDYVPELYSGQACVGWCDVTQGQAVTVVAKQTTEEIDFNLQQGGAIAGTVSAADGGEPLSDVDVEIYTRGGDWVGSDWTDAEGHYRIPGLLEGDYVVRIWSAGEYIPELYGGLACVGDCDVTRGQTVSVAAKQTTTEIDFALQQGGVITGRLNAADSGEPLIDIGVEIYTAGGDWVGSDWSGAEGHYRVGGLSDGDYVVRLRDAGDYVPELYGGQLCVGWCDVTQGQKVSVAANQITAEIDFALKKGGAIAGVATAADSGEPLRGVNVSIYTAGGQRINSGRTDHEGHYHIGGLSGGDYLLLISDSGLYVSGLYGGQVCLGRCDVTRGQTVTVAVGKTTAEIDFVMQKGGAITGVVTTADGGESLSEISVGIYTSRGEWFDSTRTGLDGSYQFDRLPEGSYSIRVTDTGEFVPELYGGQVCLGWCDVTQGQTVAVAAGKTTAEIDFALQQGGGIAGVVTTADSGEPLGDLYVDIYIAGGHRVGSSWTDAEGRYRIGGLVDGDYVLRIWEAGDYVPELYGGQACVPGCDVTQGQAVTVVAKQTTEEIDFTLELGGIIAGSVTVAGSGAPLSDVSVDIYTTSGARAGSAWSDAEGHYRVGGLVDGDYVLRIWEAGDYVPELYAGQPCLGWCDVTQGQAVTVAAGQAAAEVDFSLQRGGVIAGVVSAADSGEPLSDVGVDIYTTNGARAGSAWSDAEGRYRFGGLLDGDYVVRLSSTGDYLPELYAGQPCLGWCDVTQGQAVTVAAGQAAAEVDFSLQRGGVIAGVVTAAGSGEPLSDVDVSIYTAGGKSVGSGWTDASGHYRVGGLLEDDYVVRLSNTGDYVPEVYGTGVCLGCDPGDLTTVAVSKGENVTGIDFSLVLGGAISGVLRDEESGEALSHGGVYVYDLSGNQVGTGWTDKNGNYRVPGLPTGEYYVQGGRHGYINELYDVGACSWWPLCDVTQGTTVVVTAERETTGIDFALQVGGIVEGVVTAADGGNVVSFAHVVVYGSDGKAFSYVFADKFGAYEIRGLPAGSYYLWVTEEYSFIDAPSDAGGPCPTGCDVTQGTRVAVELGETIDNVDLLIGNVSATSDNPTFEGIADLQFAAISASNPVNLSVVTALDAQGNTLLAVPDQTGPFKPGIHFVTWTATDTAGRSSSVVQKITVLPAVNLGSDQIVGEGGAVKVTAVLTMAPERYPVEIPFTVSGSAENPADHDAQAGTLVFASGTEASLSFNVVDDGLAGELDETVVITLQDSGLAESYGVVLGNKMQTVTITESNLPPSVTMQAQQSGAKTRIVTRDGGTVAIKAHVNDSNPNESHSFDWSLSDASLVDGDGDLLNDVSSLDPATLVSGNYSLRLKVTDLHGASSISELMIAVVETAPALSDSQDSDGDGVSDGLEGYGDKDNDAVPDYLDAISIVSQLQGVNGEQGAYLLQVSPGLQLSLGTTAFASGQHSAAVSEADVVEHGGSGGGAALSNDIGYDYPAGLYDFTVSGLIHGSSVNVVLPQAAVITEGSVYRKYMQASGWQDFVVDAVNVVASAPGVAGYCPPPGDSSYIEGLHAGDYCVQLTLLDGGPNDADAVINGAVKDPGGVAVVDLTPDRIQPAKDSSQHSASDESLQTNAADNGGGGGQLGWELLLLLAWWCCAFQPGRVGRWLR